IYLRPDGAGLNQGFYFRSEVDRAVIGHDVVHGLDAEAVARKHKAAARLVPNRECEHSAKVSDRARAMLFVKMNDRFRVARGSISVAPLFERASVVAVVVD